MTRVEIDYDGQSYSVRVDDPGEFHERVRLMASDGEHHWLEVDRGEGALEVTSILIGPSTRIALTVVLPSEGAGLATA